MSMTLRVSNLCTRFELRAGWLAAVRGVSFSIAKGQIVGLVGESGSGKSVTGLSIMRLVQPPGVIASGSIELNGTDLTSLSDAEMRRVRGGKIAMIFQDPMMTLNPVLRVGTQMTEALFAHRQGLSANDARATARDALGLVGIPSPEERLDAYPHQLSGGMRQRVVIAIAMMNRPSLIIADEPTTALDVTIQSQIIYELQQLTQAYQLSMLWITHDLSLVGSIAQDVLVMYAGQIVEHGAAQQLLARPMHHYTRGLLGSVPTPNAKGHPLTPVPGTMPPLSQMPSGCTFRNRCARADDDCLLEQRLVPLDNQQGARCAHPGEFGDAM